jgi:hypothetical protein
LASQRSTSSWPHLSTLRCSSKTEQQGLQKTNLWSCALYLRARLQPKRSVKLGQARDGLALGMCFLVTKKDFMRWLLRDEQLNIDMSNHPKGPTRTRAHMGPPSMRQGAL